MPKSKDADNGAANMKAVLANQSSLADLKDDQLAALGGSRDPIDAEDFSEADFGNDVTESPSDEADDETDTKTDDEDKDDGDSEEREDGEAADTDSDGDPEGEEDAEEGEEDAEEGADDESAAGDDDAGGEGDAGEGEGDDADAGDDAEDSDEDEPEEDADEEEPKGKKDQRVPLDRFRKVNKQMRDMQRELEALKAERAAEKGKDPENEEAPYDFDAAEERYQDLVLDGKKKDAALLRKEIRAAERAEFQKDADVAGSRHAEASHSKRALDRLSAQYEEAYPAMNEAHDDFNPEVTLEVEAAMLGYLQQDYPPELAFKKALDKTVKLFGLEPAAPAGKKGGKIPEGKGKDKGKAKGKTPDPVKQKQKEAAGKEKASKARKAPPNTTKVGDAGDEGGDRGGKLDIANMSDEEFNALPKSKLARLRGDVF